MSKKIPSNITREEFYLHVADKIKLPIPLYHVRSVVAIILEEITADLKAGLRYELGNFGTFLVKQMGPREHRDVTTGAKVVSEGSRSLRFELDRKFRQFLLDRLDLDATFGADYSDPIVVTTNEFPTTKGRA